MNRKNLGLKLAEWHGGQWTNLYAISCVLMDGKLPSIKLIHDSMLELHECKDSISESDPSIIQDLGWLIAELAQLENNSYFSCTYKLHEGRGKAKKVWEETRVYRRMSFDEYKAIANGSHVQFWTRQNFPKDIKVTSVKTWKTRPGDIRLGLKYGLYEYSYAMIEAYERYSGEILVVEVENESTD